MALKISSPKIVHKTELEGIALNLNGPDDLGKAYGSMAENLNKRMPQVEVDRFLVQFDKALSDT